MNLYGYPLNPTQYIDLLGLTAEYSRNDDNSMKYVDNPRVFHCGFDGYLKNRTPTPENLIGECFYDSFGGLFDENHKDKGCKGTPDQYPASDWWNHTFNDSGGMWECGWEALKKSGDMK